MDSELAALEQKLAKLLADYHRVRAENESLQRELARAHDQVKTLAGRMTAATTRLDSLLQQLPESAE